MHYRPIGDRPEKYLPYGKQPRSAWSLPLVVLGFGAAVIGMTVIAAVCVYVFGKIVGII